MRRMAPTATAVAALAITSVALAQIGTVSVPYATPNFGGMIIDTVSAAATTGFARVQPAASTTPSGTAIMQLRRNDVLISETGLPGTGAVISGRTYAEVNGPVNTSLAFINPGVADVTILFNFTDQSGNDFGQGQFTLAPNAQLARFINEPPFSSRFQFAGTFTFKASAPVGVLALRTLLNERNEPLTTAQPIFPLPDNIAVGQFVLAHFADGAGWKSQLMLVNTTDVPMRGRIEFLAEDRSVIPNIPFIFNRSEERRVGKGC